MQIPFTKAEGAQNDFVIIDDRDQRLDEQMRVQLARIMCHRRLGVGSDGLIIIENSADADFTMCFHNPDGSSGAMCGNGGRCAVRFAHAHGIVGDTCTFRVLDRLYTAELRDDDIRLYFPPPRELRLDMHLTDEVFGEAGLICHFIDTGAPHVVLFTDDLASMLDEVGVDDVPVDSLGSFLRHHAAFAPAGTNVNFVEVQQDGVLFIRTFERGVEAETMACGTGTTASALAAALRRGCPPPITLITRGGDTLRVGFENADFAGLHLEGPATLVFDGAWTVDE